MRNVRAIGALSLLIVSGAMAASPAPNPRLGSLEHRSSPWRVDDDRMFTRWQAAPNFGLEGRLRRLLKVAAQGEERFAPEELALLDAYNAGFTISSIEAETLVSRVLHLRYIAGQKLTNDQENLLARFHAFSKAKEGELGERTALLNASVGRTVQPPDDSRAWELYSSPELFNQLDGLKRVLEAKYGKKGGLTRLKHDEAADPLPGLLKFLPIAPPPPAAMPGILVNNPAVDLTTQDTQSETSIILGAAGVVLSSFNDSGAYANPGSLHFTGTSRSTNSGGTWNDQGTLPTLAGGEADFGDPSLARSVSTGTIILATLGVNQLPIFRSTDGGQTFGSTPANGGVTASGGYDKEWVAADNFAGVGQGNFYMYWRDFTGTTGGMIFSRSTDDGVTWGNRQRLAVISGQGAQVVVGADHAVYCMWLAGTTIVVRKSTDLGITFAPLTTVATLRTAGVNGDLALGGGFRTNAFPQVVAHPSDPNQLYVVWNDKGIGASTDKGNIYFAKTANGGTTWSTPVQVNTDAGISDQWQPVIAITPDGTGVFVSWYDRRVDGVNTLIDTFARFATVSGTNATFGGLDFRASDTSFPVVRNQDPVINTTYMGDYDQATADNSFYYRTWSDNRLPGVAPHTNQPDVRFLKFAVPGPYALLAANGAAQVAENCTPPNGVPDAGEFVTMNLTVINGGLAGTTSVMGTLQATGGVTLPSAPQNFGAIAPGGSVTMPFTFKVGAACGGTVTPSLQLQDGATNEGTVTYGPFTVGSSAPTAFANAGAITINDNLAATPYPSTVTVSGITDPISRVTVSLNLMSHTFPGDVDIILVGPGGQKAYVMSDVGGSTDIVNVNLTFDDNAAAALGTGAIVSGTYRPSNIDTSSDVFPVPAPAGPFAASFASFSGLSGASVNGTWSLYVRDDAGTDVGSIAGGWTLTVYTPVCATTCGSADLAIAGVATPSPNVAAGANITYTYTVTNLGPDPATNMAITTGTAPGTTFVSASASGGMVLSTPAVGGTGAVTGTWAGTTASGVSQTVTLVVNVPAGTAGGTVITDGATVSSSSPDGNGANNVTPGTPVTVVAPTGVPTLTSFSPSSGAAGTVVTLVGYNLAGLTGVAFNGTPTATFSVIAPTQAKATVPVGATTGPISATNSFGTSITTARFTVPSTLPRITSFSPTSGTTGTVVTINGTNLAGATAVTFNGVPATTFTQVSATQIKATVPAAATTGPIAVTTPMGTGSTGTVKFTKF